MSGVTSSKLKNAKPAELVTPKLQESNIVIAVDELTEDPTKCWEKYQVHQTHEKVEPLPLDTPIYEDKVRFVCVSDTHAKDGRWEWEHRAPPGDVFIHAGDFTKKGEYNATCQLNAYMASLPHKYKFLIAGNHDMTMEPPPGGLRGRYGELRNRFGVNCDQFIKSLEGAGMQHPSELMHSSEYLLDQETTAFGFRIYGSPWQPTFGNWGFNLDRGEEILKKWNEIPEGIDVLITHGPPLGHGDLCDSDRRAGCVELLNTIQKRVKPKYHIFGHIHEAYGISTDGHTTYINASIMNQYYQPKNPPIIFDIPLPPGVKKEDFPPQKLPEKKETSLDRLIAMTKRHLETGNFST